MFAPFSPLLGVEAKVKSGAGYFFEAGGGVGYAGVNMG